MKFSFDFEKYRDNLADDIREKRKESKQEARDALEKEQKEERYKIAKEAKAVDLEIKKVESLAKEEFEKSDLSIKTIDIKDKIPEKIQLAIDRKRLTEIKYRGQDEEIKKSSSKLRFDKEIMDEAKEFVNEITNGDFLNPERLNTAIGGYRKNLPHKMLSQSEKVLPKEKTENIRKLSKEKHKDDSSEKVYIPETSTFSPGDPIIGRGDNPRFPNLWFAAGDSHWWDPVKQLVIVNPYSKRFKDSIFYARTPNLINEEERASINPKDMEDEEKREIVNKELNKLVQYANKNTLAGIEVCFKREEERVLFKDIADWIVDLPNGVVYKIEEKEKEEEAGKKSEKKDG